MNMHVPQSIVTEHELRAIAAVPYQIMSPKECKPLVAVVQDVALGIYRLTKKHITISEKQLFNLLCVNSKFDGTVPKAIAGEGKWFGHQALSAILPPKVNLKSANNSYNEQIDDKDNFVIIENGQIKQGTIDKKIYQNRTKGLIHSIYNDCGEEETRHFFDNTQKLICNWLVQSGFSVGISDLIVDDETQDNLKKIIHDMKVQVYDIIKDIHMNKFENFTINNNHDYFESEINKILNKAREQTGKKGLSKINDLENRMINMIKSGSKGSVINVANMIAFV
jgi:DNA-directed RNA polymerase II subunit RPB1